MSMLLRYNTASQEILLGTFVDDTDGKTAENALSIANTDIKIWKEGATSEVDKNSGGATFTVAGRYYAVLDATDTNTLGKLEVNVFKSGALPVRREFMVVPQEVYDAIVLNNLPVPTTGSPSNAPNVFTALLWLYKWWRNKKVITSGTTSLLGDDDSTTEQQWGLSDSSGTTTISKVEAPP
jgi:hypothetical protein